MLVTGFAALLLALPAAARRVRSPSADVARAGALRASEGRRRGRRTPATATSAASSSRRRRGSASAASADDAFAYPGDPCASVHGVGAGAALPRVASLEARRPHWRSWGAVGASCSQAVGRTLIQGIVAGQPRCDLRGERDHRRRGHARTSRGNSPVLAIAARLTAVAAAAVFVGSASAQHAPASASRSCRRRSCRARMRASRSAFARRARAAR